MSEPETMQNDTIDPQILNFFELGQSLYKQGDFVAASVQLTQFCSAVDKSASEYSEAIFSRLRILTEMNLVEDRLRLEAELLNDITSFDAKGMATFYYLKGYNCLSEQKIILSSEYFEKSLSEAMKSESLEIMIQALFGCVFVGLNPEIADPGLEAKIKKLELLINELNRAEFHVSLLSLKADMALKNNDQTMAIQYAWQAYDKVKFTKNNFLNLSIIAKLGHVYLQAKKFEEAKTYLELAQRSVDASIYKRLSLGVEQLLSQLPMDTMQKFDLVLDEKNHLILEKKKGPIDMKNQFILMDLLKLLMTNPGQPISKEKMVDHIWHQKYDPKIHDNSIYVTIKRIRSLIEPHPNRSIYILRNRQGYLFSPDKKICITPEGTAQ